MKFDGANLLPTTFLTWKEEKKLTDNIKKVAAFLRPDGTLKKTTFLKLHSLTKS